MNPMQIIYPATILMLLTFFLYFKNYLDNKKAYKSNILKSDYFRAYQGESPEYIEVLRQTLKNQFELPILFYFIVSITFNSNNITILDLIFGWLFVISRYIHCYIRLTSNYILYRAFFFKIGLILLIFWWIYFFIKCFNY